MRKDLLNPLRVREIQKDLKLTVARISQIDFLSAITRLPDISVQPVTSQHYVRTII